VTSALQRLAATGIQIVPSDSESHFILEREGFVVLVERRDQGFGNTAAPMFLCERGFAALLWRDQRPYFVGKGFEMPAEEDQVRKLRSFAKDVENALQD